MLAKAIQTRRNGLSAAAIFKARISYCCSKASLVATGNLAGHWRDAAFQMYISSRLHDRLRDPSHHVVLTWADGETPDDGEVIEAAHMAVRELGGHAHQYIVAVHRDRPNVHGHIVLNRVNPLTGAALPVSHDYARLERACRRIEHHFGWPPDRGRFDTKIVDGEVRLVPKPADHWKRKRAEREAGVRQDPRGVRGACRRSGRGPLKDRLSRDVRGTARALIQGAADWGALHTGLLKLGLRYFAHGSGARIEETATHDWMPACHLGAAFALPKLVERLGRFVPGVVLQDQKEAAQSREMEQYRKDRQARRDELAQLQHRQRDQRRRFDAALTGLPRPVAAAFRLVLRQDQQERLFRMRKARPLPCLRDYGLEASAPPSDPTTQWARRYRHGLRRTKARQDGFSLASAQFDHTSRRQLWHRPIRDDAGVFQGPDSGNDTANLRRLGTVGVMIPRRGRQNDILGFEIVKESWNGELVNIADAPGLGLGLLGNRDGKHCFLVADAVTGMRVSAKKPAALVIIASDAPTPRQAAQITALVGSRRATDVLVSSQVRAAFLEQMAATPLDLGILDPSATTDGTDPTTALDIEEDDLPSPSPD